LILVRDACTQAVPVLAEAADLILTLCHDGESTGGDLTIQAYQATWERTRSMVRKGEASLAGVLCSLRADLVAGALPPSAWPIHDWLAHILQSLAAGLLRVEG
jgi:hypothetical protein